MHAVSLNTIAPVKIMLILFFYHSSITLFQVFFFVCCLPDLSILLFSMFCFPFSYLIFKYLNTVLRSFLRSTWSAFLSHFLSDSPPPFCLVFYFLISLPSSILFPFPLLALPLPIYATCFTRVPQKFGSSDHCAVHLMVWRGPAP